MTVILLAGLGLALGSFINALVWRLHEQSLSRKKARDAELSIVRGRSMCPGCRHALGAGDLIPLFSWLALRGKCRYCQKPISVQYPLVESVTAVLVVISLLAWPYGFGAEGIALFASWLALLTGLIALAVYDIRWMLLPNRMVYPLTVFWAGVVVGRALLFNGGLSLIVGALLGALACGGLFWLLFQLSDGKWIGGGDVKLGFLLGLLAGNALQSFLIIFIASLLGTLWIMPMLINKKLGFKAQIPFGPFLIASAIIVFLFGAHLLEVFSGYFLLV